MHTTSAEVTKWWPQTTNGCGITFICQKDNTFIFLNLLLMVPALMRFSFNFILFFDYLYLIFLVEYEYLILMTPEHYLNS